jgi:predicted nuclease of predicted toxin-antitoxin system
LKYLANENVPFSSITYLKSKGYDIKAVGVDDPSITDEQVMQIAIDENRTIITYDSDYGELIFKHGYKPQAGVIFIRIQPTEPLETAKILEELLNKKNYFI